MSEQNKVKSPLSLLGLTIWGLAALFFLYEFFLRTFVGSVAHQVIPDLQLNAETFSIIGSAYYAAYGLMQVPVGILADKFGVKLIMIFAVLVCALSAFFFAHATGFFSAFTSRLLMGFGSSFAFVCLLVIAITWFPRKFFGFFAGSSQFIGTMGPLLAGGPLIALMANYHLSWRATLGKIALFGVLLAILLLLIVKDKPRDTTEDHLIVLKRPEPLKKLLLRLFKNNQAWFVATYSATIYISMSLLGAIWGTEYLQVRGLSQHIAANIISLSWLGYAVGCPLLGAFSDIAKRRKPTLAFCALLGLIATVCITYLPLTSPWLYGLFFFTLGMASAGQNVGFATIAEHVDLPTRATAMGLNNGSITFFGAFIPPLASYFIYSSAGADPHQLKPENFIVAFSIMPVLYILSFIISTFFIKETYCRPQKEAILLKVDS